MNKPIIIILWLLLGLFYWWMKSSNNVQCCNKEDKLAIVQIDTLTNKVSTPYYFTNDYDTVYINDTLFNQFIDSILSYRYEGDTLQITAWQYKNESDTEDSLALCLHRAKIMADYLQSKNIVGPFKLSGVIIGDINFKDKWYNPTIFKVLVKDEVKKEIENRHVIYHEYGDSEIIASESALNYLNLLAEKIIKTEESVRITGHADSSGNAQFNQALSLKRAEVVAQRLMDLGVASSQIIIIADGENDPIAPNDVEELRNNNRRTTLEIISKK